MTELVADPGAASAGESRPGTRPAAHAPGAGWRFFALCLALTFVNFAAWSVATPLFASPDEPTQVARAAAVVRGQLVGRTVGSDRNAVTGISIPRVFAAGGTLSGCYAFHDTVPASCSPALPSSTRTVRTTTYVGRYPPLYYLVVGLPSLAAVSKLGVYLMRLVAALLNAVLVSLALLCAARWSRRRLLLVGVLAATTPMVWFLGGMVNPSGLEICAGICAWTAATVLVFEHAADPPPGLVAVAGASLCVLVLTRPLSPLWAAGIVTVVALAGGWGAVRGVMRSAAVRAWIAPLVASGAFAMWWIFSQHSLDLLPVGAPIPHPETTSHILAVIFGRTGLWLHEMIGVFGWLDTNSPLLTYLVWFGALALVVALGLGVTVAVRGAGTARRTLALALLVAAVVVIPVLIAYSQVHRLGIVWQGRDILPLAVGVPILAAAYLSRADVAAWGRVPFAALVCGALAVADGAAFLEAMRRYAVGVAGTVDFFGGSWAPPFGNVALAVWGCAALALVMGFVVLAQLDRPRLTGLGGPTS